MKKPTFAVRQSRWVLAHCPCTGKEVVGSGWNQHFSIPNGQASWWFCPACAGWHIVMVNDPLLLEIDYSPVTLVNLPKETRPIRPTSSIMFIKKHEPKFLPEYFWAKWEL